jgi:hypothetical protein
MLSNVLHDIININNIPSSYIFEHIQAICLLTERLILLTVAIPMELFSWLRVGAQSTSLVKYITWLTYSEFRHTNIQHVCFDIPESKQPNESSNYIINISHK